jgi:hydroxymethylpyrimidine/phosphomethylpyrimidine kinase
LQKRWIVPRNFGRVLIIAGSDSGGGAGIQGDIKTVTMLGGYAATAVTALTAQNTQGVFGIHEVPDDFIAKQMRLVLDDIGADVIKTGMLHKASVIETVADVLEDYPDIPLIVDPVMVAKGGAALLQNDAINVLIKRLIPRARLITPNIPEAELLALHAGCKLQVASCRDMQTIGEALLTLGCEAVLIKGGHMTGNELTDVLVTTGNSQLATCNYFTSLRINTRHTHGTGCTLASAIAAGLAQGMSLNDSVARARNYVMQAIQNAPGLGKGHGPLGHGFCVEK